MTDERRRARIAMLQQCKTIKTVCAETGYARSAIQAALSNAPVSRKLRQAICNSLQIELWGLQPTERYLHIPRSWGMQIEFLNAKHARDAVDELGPDVVTRRGKTITLVKPVTFVVEVRQSQPNARARNRKIWGGSKE
jgi:hypothetical protein